MSDHPDRLPGANSRLLKGYAPAVALVVIYALIVVFTPSVARERVVRTTGASSNSVDTGGAGALAPGDRGASLAAAGAATGSHPATGSTSSCGPQQVPGDPYSPPCIAWAGDNGGTTYRGVSKDSIRLGVRLTTDPGLQALLGQLANGRDVPKETADDVRRTAFGLIDYFNKHFQFYGRKLVGVQFQGRGSAVNEAIGGGQDLANADAIKAAQELNLFADVSAFTAPYANALAQQGVMAFGAPYMSQKWFQQHAPYAWSIVPDCTKLAQANIAAYVKYLAHKPATWAGGDLKDKPRSLAIIAPNSPVYQECVDDGLAKLKTAGGGDALRLDYTLDPGSLSTQAGNLVDQLKSHHITSVALGTDPLLPLFLTQKAQEQDYHPEWLVLGTALTDADIAGQQYVQSEWSHAFGISMLGPQTDARATYGYQAFKSVHPDQEPSITVDLVYYQLYEVVIGLQLAGPKLNPQTFAQGMFKYRGGTGLAGTWHFAPGDYTAQDDGVAIWWDADGTSPYNGKPGRYVQASPRSTPENLPAEPPTFFKK